MSDDIEFRNGFPEEPEISQDNDYALPEIQPPLQGKRRFVWLFVDLVCMGAVGLAIIIFKFAVVPYRRGFYCDDDSINKPYKESTVSSTVLYSVGYGLALLVIFIIEWFYFRNNKRSGISTEDVDVKLGPLTLNPAHTQFLRIATSVIFGGLTTVFVTDVGKYTVGRLRPHFLAICKPPPSVFINCSHNYILDDVCTGDPGLLREGRLSFPSGHASFSGTLCCYKINQFPEPWVSHHRKSNQKAVELYMVQ